MINLPFLGMVISVRTGWDRFEFIEEVGNYPSASEYIAGMNKYGFQYWKKRFRSVCKKNHVFQTVRREDKIPLIKYFREVFKNETGRGAGLRLAKEFIESIYAL